MLQDSFIKKQQRKNYPDRNVIYMLTTEDNKKKRNYIIGTVGICRLVAPSLKLGDKATNLTQRLSGYNKTAEHEVVYYKTCTIIQRSTG